MEICFNGTACPIKYLHIGVKNNNLVDEIVFCVDRITSEGVDLSEFTPYVKIQNEKDGYIDKDGKITVEITETKLRLIYRLRRKTTSHHAFEMQLQFEKEDSGDCVVWQTEIINITLSRAIEADETITEKYPSVLQDLTARVSDIENIKIINGGQP